MDQVMDQLLLKTVQENMGFSPPTHILGNIPHSRNSSVRTRKMIQINRRNRQEFGVTKNVA